LNSKTMKLIRKKSLDILAAWMHTLVPEEDQNKITPANVEDFLSQQEYIYNNKTLYKSIYTRSWVVSVLKKMIKDGHTLNNIDYTMFNNSYRKYIYGKN